MLDEIKKEKEKKTGKKVDIKAIDESDQPFEIPKNWVWGRLKAVVTDIFAGGDRPNNISKKQTKTYPIPVFSNGEKNKGLYGYTDVAKVYSPALTISARGTIGYSEIRLEPYVPIVRLISIVSDSVTYLKYLKYYFDYNYEIGTGSSTLQLTIPMIKDKVVPLPPFAEQERIVNRIEELLEKIDNK